MRGSQVGLLQFRWTSGEEDLHDRTLVQPSIQLGDRSVDQEQNENPNLYGAKPVPGKVSRHVLEDSAEGPSAEPVFDELFQESDQEHDRPVDDGLEQDRWIMGALSKRRKNGSASATSTDLPTTSAPVVASIKFHKWTK